MRAGCTAERAHAALDGFLCERVTNGVLHIPWRAATAAAAASALCVFVRMLYTPLLLPMLLLIAAVAAAASSRATNWKVIVRGLKDTADRRL